MHECIYKCTCNVREVHIQYYMSFGGSWLGEEGGGGGGGVERGTETRQNKTMCLLGPCTARVHW